MLNINYKRKQNVASFLFRRKEKTSEKDFKIIKKIMFETINNDFNN
jgi:hypothetical protein